MKFNIMSKPKVEQMAFPIGTVNHTAKANKNICVFTVTRPTLIFASDTMHFYTEFG